MGSGGVGTGHVSGRWKWCNVLLQRRRIPKCSGVLELGGASGVLGGGWGSGKGHP